VFTSDQKGSIAEMAIAYNAIKLGIDVYRPLSDGTRCDLIFDTGALLLPPHRRISAKQPDSAASLAAAQ